MFDITKVKGILFDYGGTIDSDGLHWAEVIWTVYQEREVPVSKEVFREAYLVAGQYPHESMYLLQHLFNNWFLNVTDFDCLKWSYILATIPSIVLSFASAARRSSASNLVASSFESKHCVINSLCCATNLG